ncbi:MAG: hypothetical protein JWN98_1487 [Abditibacteriota bacterium]|nr:hypothetical protein [Abditibacteriota bacterium]
MKDGPLEIFVAMQNGGLPEAGDFVLAMPPVLLQGLPKYFEAASLSAHGEVFLHSLEAAYQRRNLAVQGFIELRRRYDEDGPSALREFYDVALICDYGSPPHMWGIDRLRSRTRR